MKCDKCKRKDWCDSHSMEYDSCVMGGFSDYLPLTNADKLRAMTDEELADWIHQVQDEDAYRKENFLPPLSAKWWLDWLKKRAE